MAGRGQRGRWFGCRPWVHPCFPFVAFLGGLRGLPHGLRRQLRSSLWDVGNFHPGKKPNRRNASEQSWHLIQTINNETGKITRAFRLLLFASRLEPHSGQMSPRRIVGVILLIITFYSLTTALRLCLTPFPCALGWAPGGFAGGFFHGLRLVRRRRPAPCRRPGWFANLHPKEFDQPLGSLGCSKATRSVVSSLMVLSLYGITQEN